MKIKKHLLKFASHIVRFFSLMLILSGAVNVSGQMQGPAAVGTVDDEIMAAIKSNDGRILQFNDLFEGAARHRQQMIRELIQIFDDPKSLDATKGAAAYYLSVLHASNAVDSLGNQMALTMPRTGHLFEDESAWRSNPVAQALISIGAAALPVVIRNLAGSDDAKVQALSLQVMVHIDNDKDITQLRLQKALKAETDPLKQARLQAAMKSLSQLK